MARRPWRIVLAATPLLVASAACSDDDDSSATSVAATVTAAATASDATIAAATSPPTTTPLTTTAPSLTTPASVITDTEAVGGSTLSTVDLATGTATVLGAVGAEVGVLGIAVDGDGAVVAVTDAPGLLTLDPHALPPPGTTPTPIDTGGATLLAVARRPSDGALFAVGDGGGIVRLDPATATVTTVAEVAVDDPGVGLDVVDDGTLEVLVATGGRFAVDPETGEVTDLPPLTADEAPPRIVAVAHDASGRYGIDASTDELVRIADDGLIDTVGPLGFDVTDGASLDIGADGVAILANPG